MPIEPVAGSSVSPFFSILPFPSKNENDSPTPSGLFSGRNADAISNDEPLAKSPNAFPWIAAFFISGFCSCVAMKKPAYDLSPDDALWNVHPPNPLPPLSLFQPDEYADWLASSPAMTICSFASASAGHNRREKSIVRIKEIHALPPRNANAKCKRGVDALNSC